MSEDTSTSERRFQSPSLINRAAVRRMALRFSRETRLGKFTRVSAEFLDACELNLYYFIRSRVHAHPSLGKTLK